MKFLIIASLLLSATEVFACGPIRRGAAQSQPAFRSNPKILEGITRVDLLCNYNGVESDATLSSATRRCGPQVPTVFLNGFGENILVNEITKSRRKIIVVADSKDFPFTCRVK